MERVLNKKTKAPFGVRMSEEMKSWLAIQAKNNLRSMNAEIVSMLKERMDKESRSTGIVE